MLIASSMKKARFLFHNLVFGASRRKRAIRRQTMYLNDILRICLLALHSRFPRQKVDINEAVLEIYDVESLKWIEKRGWPVGEIITILEKAAPELLRSPAHLVIDGCNSAIYLPEYSRSEPAFNLHCGAIITLKLEYVEL
jgi:hypothetical protein